MKKVLFLIIVIMGIVMGPSVYASRENENKEITEAEFPGGWDALYKWFENNAHYPANALANNISYAVVVFFDITTEGNVDNIFFAVEGYPEFDYEVYCLMSRMPKWHPATECGRPASDHKSIVVLFNANQAESKDTASVSIAIPVMDKKYSFLDFLVMSAEKNRELPKYSGMNSVDTTGIPYLYTDAKFYGGKPNLRNWLAQNVSYPEQAYKQGIEGVAKVKFRVKEDGSIDNMNVLEHTDPMLEIEALRVLRNMPKWIPATLSGKPIVSYSILSITFKIPKK